MEEHYAFGKNWQKFLRTLTPQKEERARASLRESLRTDSLRGKTFLDIGSGSGLFSLAAHMLGAASVTSVDIDPFSVACTRHLRERAGNPSSWHVTEGSVLETDFLRTLGTFDVVYSWGVLHHTGSMWQAIDNAASLVAPGGQLFIAIYNTTERFGPHKDGRVGSSRFWKREKRMYNALPAFLQRCVDAAAMSGMVLLYLLTLRNPFRIMADHERRFRGMDWATDIRDWLGGWPYEHATSREIMAYVEKKGFSLELLREVDDLRNNEFVFRKL